MQKQLLSLSLLLISLSLNAQTWQWAAGIGANGGNENATAIVTDGASNVYVAGNFTGSSLTFGGNTLTNGGATDMFIVKYDPWGGVVWAKRIGGTNNDKVHGLAIDFNGDLLITGIYFSNVLSFGSVFLTNTTAGYSDLFLAKLDPSGTILWAKKGGGNNNDISNSISSDPTGNIFIGGSFSSTTLTFGTSSVTKTGNQDAFIARFDMNGNYNWAVTSSGTGSMAECTSVCADANGNINATGYFNAANVAFQGTTLINSGDKDVFVVKYNGNGVIYWAKSAGGPNDDKSNAICNGSNGDVYITGNFVSSVITFGTTTYNNTNPSTEDIFLAKLDQFGNFGWARTSGGNGSDAGNGITTDASGNVYITGYYSSIVNFGSATLTTNGTLDIFLARYNSSGVNGYAKGAGGTAVDISYGIALSPSNNAYLAGGFFSSSFQLGSTTLLNANTGDSLSDIFVTMLNHVNNINDIANEYEFTAFPNPSTGIVTLNFPLQANELFVYNSEGKCIQKQLISGNKSDLIFNDDGIYLVKVSGNDVNYTKKIIIQH